MPERQPQRPDRPYPRDMRMLMKNMTGADFQASGEALKRLDVFEDGLNQQGWALSPLGRYEIYRDLLAEVMAEEQMKDHNLLLRRGVSTDPGYHLRFEQDPEVHKRRMRRDPEYRNHWLKLMNEDRGYAAVGDNGGEQEQSTKGADGIPSQPQRGVAVSTKPTKKIIESQGYPGPGFGKVLMTGLGLLIGASVAIYACSQQPESQQPDPVKLPPPLPTPITFQRR